MVGHPAAARHFEAVELAVEVRGVAQDTDAAQLERWIESRHRVAAGTGHRARRLVGRRNVVGRCHQRRIGRRTLRERLVEVAVVAVDVVEVHREPLTNLTARADDELVGRVVLQVGIDRVRRRRQRRVGRVPVAGYRLEVGEVAVGRLHFVGLDDTVAVEVDPGVSHGHRTRDVDLARHAAVADLPVVTSVVGADERLVVALQVVGEPEARREVVERDTRVDAAERKRRQQVRQDRVCRDRRGARRLMVVVVADSELRRQPPVRHRVLHVERVVQQIRHRVAVARQRDRAAGCDACRAGVAVVGRLGRETRRRVAARVRDGLAVGVLPVGAELDGVIGAELRRQEVVAVEADLVHGPDVDALRGRTAVESVDTINVGCTVVSDGSWKPRMKLLPTCERTARRSGSDRLRPTDRRTCKSATGLSAGNFNTEARGHRVLNVGRLDRVQVRCVARVALLGRHAVEQRQLVALEQLDFTLQIRRLEHREVGVQAVVDVLDVGGERRRGILIRLALRRRLIEADHAGLDVLLPVAAPDPGLARLDRPAHFEAVVVDVLDRVARGRALRALILGDVVGFERVVGVVEAR